MTLPATIGKGMAVQYESAPGVWTLFGSCDLGTLTRTRRLGPGPRRSVTARRWRVVKIGPEPLADAVVSLKGLAFHRETADLSPHRRWSFDFDAGEQRYSLIATDGNLEVYRRSERVASIRSPYAAGQVTAVKRAQSRDTLLAFHPDVAPQRITRQGAHDEWDSRSLDLTNVPIFDYTGERQGGVDDVQRLQFIAYEPGETFNLSLEGETTTTISYSATMATLAASVQAALEALDNIGAGGVEVVSPEDKVLTVTFRGRNRADDVGELAPATISSAEGGVRVATLTQGQPGGEPVISDTRGWPSCGAFFEQRLWLAGLRSRPQAVLGSRLGLFFDFQTKGADADKGIDVNLDTDEATEILALFPGQHLMALTLTGLFFCPVSPITPPAPFLRATKLGVEADTPVLELDGDPVFVQAGGATVAQAVYDDGRQKYLASPLSAYAAHRTAGIVAAGMRRGKSTDEPSLAVFVRADGEAAAMHALLAQEVLGFQNWTTEGAFTEAGGELAGDLYVCTRRHADGDETHRLERLDAGAMLDASVRVEGPCGSITGLEHLEGRTVCLYVDGGDAGDAVVAGGQVVLPRPAQRGAEAGLLFQPQGRLLPFAQTEDPRAGASMHARVGEIAVHLGATANLKIGMAGKRMWPLSLKRRDRAGAEGALLDHGPGEDAFEGWTRLYPVPGFQKDAQVAFVQERPGPLTIKEVVATVTS